MTKQCYQIIINKNLFVYLVRSRFLTKITAPAPAPAKYGGSTAPAPQHWLFSLIKKPNN